MLILGIGLLNYKGSSNNKNSNRNSQRPSNTQPTPSSYNQPLNEARTQATPPGRMQTITPGASPLQPRTSTTSLPPNEHYNCGVELWMSNRAAAVKEFQAAADGGDPDAYYYLGLNFAEGRDPSTLQRAELVAALRFFQLAQHGRFRVEARSYEELLGKEYDRRRNIGNDERRN